MAKGKNRYSIPFQGLSLGSHSFEFECDSDFFDRLSGGVYPAGNCRVVVKVEKGANLITLSSVIKGEVEVECDRCLDPFLMEVDYEGSLFVKFSAEVNDPVYDSDLDGETDILWMNPADSYIELDQYIYESVILSLPPRKVHGVDENGESLCNPDMLARFSIEPDGFGEDYDDEEDDDFED